VRAIVEAAPWAAVAAVLGLALKGLQWVFGEKGEQIDMAMKLMEGADANAERERKRRETIEADNERLRTEVARLRDLLAAHGISDGVSA
jgi:hypothetical protein